MKSLSKKSATKWLLSSAIASTLIFTLAGCSNTEEENPKLEKTSDASVTEPTDYVPASADGPAQNVPEPRLPTAAAENSETGAESALSFFWEAEEYARLTGDTELIALVSSEECEFCIESIQGWEQSYQEGFWNVPNGSLNIEITATDFVEGDAGRRSVAHLFFELDEPATEFYDKGGQITAESFDAPEVNDWFALMYYNATAQKWEIEWIGLEENISWED